MKRLFPPGKGDATKKKKKERKRKKEPPRSARIQKALEKTGRDVQFQDFITFSQPLSSGVKGNT